MQPISCDLWLMEPNAMRQLRSLAASSIAIDIQSIRAAAPQLRKEKKVAILPVHGPMEARHSLVGEMLGMTSYEKIGWTFDQLVYDDSVSAIVMDFCTPGGMVYGCQELAEKIFSARGTKPIIGVANPMAASGGQWLIAACDRVVVTPGSDIGSIGVIREHVELSRANEQKGATVTLVRSADSPYKWDANDVEPLSEEAKAELQARTDATYKQFASAVAKYRGVTIEHVNERFGKGRLVDAKTAVSVGLADQIDTLQSIVGKLVSGRIRLGGSSACDQWDGRTVMEQRVEHIKEIESLAISVE